MRYIRFNIASLLVIILIIGFGFAALRDSNDLWDSGCLTLTLGVFLISILVAVHRTRSRRAFWIGFALFGWTYLGLSLVPSIESGLITTKGLAYLDSKVPDRLMGEYDVRITHPGSGSSNNSVQSFDVTKDGNQLANSSQGTVRLWDFGTGKLLSGRSGTTENFVRIGHSLLSLLAAILGGLLSRQLYARNRGSATV
jgi:hypothetical protein